MADEEQLKILRQGVAAWNKWRDKNPEVGEPDLREAWLIGADLRGANLSGANLYKANLIQVYLGGAKLIRANLREANLPAASIPMADLRGASLQEATLWDADLREANFSGASLGRASLSGAHLNKANLTRANLFETTLREVDLEGADLRHAALKGADLHHANLRRADLQGADLEGADLEGAQLIWTNLCDATLTGSRVYGASVWDIKVDDRTKQQNLIITAPDEPVITVDNLKVAQFIHLLLNNREIRDVIDTITSKAVLILGRFSEERKPVLDALREELRKHNYLPILFDFLPSPNQATLETIKTLASMARFVIADLTDARSVLMELVAIVPNLPSVAVRLLIKKSAPEYGMLDFIRKFSSVVKGTCEYENEEEVIASIEENIIVPAEAKVRELRQSN